MPNIPSVDVVTGTVTDGPIKDGESFKWTCSEDSGDIKVTAQLMPGGNPWFSPSPASFTAPSGSATVTAEGMSVGGWSYTANVNTDGAKIRVDSSMPKPHAKAS
ncbi:MAG: hypothetical protein WCD47_04280 [Candidatus Sulfotelmatobacter sp.]